MAAFKLVHLSKKSGRLSSVGPEILAFVSHYSANFQPILDSFIPKLELKYEDSENIIADRVTTVVFNLYQIKRRAFFGGPGSLNNSPAVKLSNFAEIAPFAKKHEIWYMCTLGYRNGFMFVGTRNRCHNHFRRTCMFFSHIFACRKRVIFCFPN